jgi:hypothetical protein
LTIAQIKTIIAFFAGYSFTLFLTHYSILYLISLTIYGEGWGAFWLSFIISNILAAAIASCSEIHYRSISFFLKKTWYNLNESKNKDSIRLE